MKRFKILLAIFGFCLSIFLLIFFMKESSDLSKEQRISIKRILSILTDEEKKDLERIYERLFFFEACAYPLFGTKPMSIGLLLPTTEEKIGWKAWGKIAPFCNSEKFVIREYTFKEKSFVLVANLDEIEKVYDQNREDFNRVFNGRMDLGALKTSLKKGGILFEELIHNHLIIGILLGYGTRNAKLFADMQLDVKKSVSLVPFSTGHPLFYYFSPVMPPFFACDPDLRETIELKRRYKEERSKIIEISKRGSLFQRMLILLSNS